MSIAIEHLTKVYGAQRAIDDISFEVKGGQVVGFLGPNGAGKSTTMKILTCFITQTSGTAKVCGFNVATHSLDVRRQIGYLPEHNPLYLEMYVHEYLRFVGRLFGMGGSALKRRVSQVIEMAVLGPEQHKKIGSLSKGYRQRVGIAQALVHDPQVLILDEPTSGLDPNQVLEIRKLIREQGKSKTVLFSSHILSEVEAIADHVIIIHKGRLVKDAPIHEAKHRGLQEQVVSLEVEKPGFDFGAIHAMPGFKHVEAASATKFYVHAEPNTEIRKAVYAESVRQNNPILSLSAEVANLEDMFRELTGRPPDA